MCIFTSPVAAVSDTRIFVRMASAGRQYLAYEMSFAAVGDTAMVLPLPVASRDEATAVRFMDLSGLPDFFDRMAKFIVMMEERHSGGEFLGAGFGDQIRAPLLVHEVGAFEASFVPSIADFSRLDSRFRLAPDVWERLPQYRDYGFAVFKLRATGAQAQHAHPMALEFSTRHADKLFAPTVHVHDGVVDTRAFFDHIIYAQVEKWTSWNRPEYFDDGVRQEGIATHELREKWDTLRSPGDWRLPSGNGGGSLGIALPAQPGHPPSIMLRLVPEWRTLESRSREAILRMCAHALTIEKQCERFAKAIWERGYATPEECAALPQIEDWMGLSCTIRILPETVRRWRALGSADRELALRNRPLQAGDAAAAAWMELHEDQRERFGRLHRWDELPPLLAAEMDNILQWMDCQSGPRRDAARSALAKEYFPLFTKAPDFLLRAADAPDAVRREAVREAVLELEPGVDEKAASLWRRTRHGSWESWKEFARMDELWPLFDTTREIHAIGLTGKLPNGDTLIGVNGGYQLTGLER